MKTVSDSFTELIRPERVIGACTVLRDNKLVFDTGNKIPSDELLAASYTIFNMDSSTFEDGILRVVAVTAGGAWYLAYHYFDNPVYPVTESTWTVTSIQLSTISRPAVWGNRIFYRAIDGAYVYRDYVDGDLTPAKLFGETVGPNTNRTGFAPVSTTIIYSFEAVHVENNEDVARITRHDIQNKYTEICPRIIFGNMGDDYKFGFDAVTLDGIDYIFYSGGINGNRAEYIKYDNNGGWSLIDTVISLDIADAEAKYILGGVSVINDRIFVVMDMVRNSVTDVEHLDVTSYEDASYIGYSMGPAPFTLGRDTYITYSRYSDDNWHNSGHLHDIDDHIIYISNNLIHIAESVLFTGYDNPTKTEDSLGLNDITIEYSVNSPGIIQAYVSSTELTNPLLDTGNELELYIKLNDEEAMIGIFGVDTVMTDRRQDGLGLSVTARTLGYKRLSMWTSDAYFDLWSQTKQSCNPYELTEVIRFDGNWDSYCGTVGTEIDCHPEDDEETVPTPIAIKLDALNVPGILYSAKSSSNNSIGRGRFYVPTESLFTANVGVIANFYQHPSTTSSNETLYSGFLAECEWNDCRLYYVHENVKTLLEIQDFDCPQNTWFWLEIAYRDGAISVRTRLDDETSWSNIIEIYYYITAGVAPFQSKTKQGRPGIYILNRTEHDNTPGFDSDSTVIPVDDSSIFTLPAVVIVDEEKIYVDTDGAQDHGSAYIKAYKTGMNTYMNATHNNTNWVNGVFYTIPMGDEEADQPICKNSYNRIISWSIMFRGKVTITSVKVRLKKVGNPSKDIYLGVAVDSWDDSGPGWASIRGSAHIDKETITTEFEWYEFVLNTPVVQTDLAEGYWIILSNQLSNWPTADADNYYVIGVDEYTPYAEGYTFLWDGPGFVSRDPICKPPTKIIGIGNGGDGYEIYVEGPTSPLPRDHFNGNALVIDEGPGKGAVYKITDFDYQAPDQWVPTRFYTPPDRWQDHVGETGHGNWETPLASRIFVDSSPSGSITEGSCFRIYGGLVVTTRGYDETVATTHNAGLVSRYSAKSALCDRLEYFSENVDMRICDVAKEICRKAGVWNFTDEKIVDREYVFIGSNEIGLEGFSTLGQSIAGYGKTRLSVPVDHRNLIIKIYPPNRSQAGISYHYTADGKTFAEGRILYINTESIRLYYDACDDDDESNNVLLASLDTWIGSAEVTVSIQEEDVSIWYMGQLVFAYHDEYTGGTGTIAWIQAYWMNSPVEQSFAVDWSACDRRIDNFALDAGTRGAQLMSTVIGKKRYYIQDTNDGGIKMTVNKTHIPGRYNLVVLAGTGHAEADIATRVRVQGLYEMETINSESMRLYGNIYAEASNEDVETLHEATYDAKELLENTLHTRGRHMLTGALDPRVEPRDVLEYTLAGDIAHVEVESVSFAISLTGNSPLFDMKIEGIDADEFTGRISPSAGVEEGD